MKILHLCLLLSLYIIKISSIISNQNTYEIFTRIKNDLIDNRSQLKENFLFNDDDCFDSPFSMYSDMGTHKFPLKELQYHGTTTLAFVFKEGIIVAVDSRASIGDYVGSSNVKKIIPITNKIIATMAGGASDCSYWIRRTTHRLRLIQDEQETILPVRAVAKLLSSSLRDYRGLDLSVGTMIAGYDFNNPQLFYVDNNGCCISNTKFCVGSGSNLAYSILDSKNINDLSLEEAKELALNCILCATRRDGYSGGNINIVHINSTGYYHIAQIDSGVTDLEL